jgi:hypothetical protein
MGCLQLVKVKDAVGTANGFTINLCPGEGGSLVTTSADLAGGFTQAGGNCGVDISTGARNLRISPLHRVRWRIATNTVAALDPPGTIAPAGSTFMLYRELLDVAKNPVPGLAQVVAEYAVDLKFGIAVDQRETNPPPNNITVFDPTWFVEPSSIEQKLEAQLAARKHPKIRLATRGYLDFLRLGGRLRFGDLTSSKIRAPLQRQLPVLTGLSATYLHRSMRELPETNQDDDLRGDPVGHFVVLCGYDKKRRSVLVADPLEHPGRELHYHVPIVRVVGAIFLGVLTYDASFLVIEPREEREEA